MKDFKYDLQYNKIPPDFLPFLHPMDFCGSIIIRTRPGLSLKKVKWLFNLHNCKKLCFPSILWYDIDRLAVVFMLSFYIVVWYW